MKSILFSTPMVAAILDGRKTQTRRVVKKLPKGMYGVEWDYDEATDQITWYATCGAISNGCAMDWREPLKPKYQPGDILWVRETWGIAPSDRNPDHEADILRNKAWDWIVYKADGGLFHQKQKWRPSIFMPREAARIFLLVTDVHAERVQNITEEEAKAEGAIAEAGYCNGVPAAQYGKSYRLGFSWLWDSINAKRGHGWEVNDWVWAYTFQRISKEGVRE
jgi:hypothetical protein